VTKVGLEKSRLLGHILTMSIAELKETADRLTANERGWLHGYLSTLERVNDPAFIAEMTRRLDSLAAGQGVAQEKVLELLHHKAATETATGA